MDYQKLIDETNEVLNKEIFVIGDRFHEMFSYWIVIVHKEEDNYLIFTGHPGYMKDDITGKYLSDNLKWLSKKELIEKIRGTNYKGEPCLLYCQPNDGWNTVIMNAYNNLSSKMKVRTLANLT